MVYIGGLALLSVIFIFITLWLLLKEGEIKFRGVEIKEVTVGKLEKFFSIGTLVTFSVSSLSLIGELHPEFHFAFSPKLIEINKYYYGRPDGQPPSEVGIRFEFLGETALPMCKEEHRIGPFGDHPDNFTTLFSDGKPLSPGEAKYTDKFLTALKAIKTGEDSKQKLGGLTIIGAADYRAPRDKGAWIKVGVETNKDIARKRASYVQQKLLEKSDPKIKEEIERILHPLVANDKTIQIFDIHPVVGIEKGENIIFDRSVFVCGVWITKSMPSAPSQ